MKTQFALAILVISLNSYSSTTSFLKISETTNITRPVGDYPQTKTIAKLNETGDRFGYLSFQIGDSKKIEIPTEALKEIQYPDFSTIRIEKWKTRNGEFCYSISVNPGIYMKNRTWYQIEFVEGNFTRVYKVWDVDKGKAHGTPVTSRQVEDLYKAK